MYIVTRNFAHHLYYYTIYVYCTYIYMTYLLYVPRVINVILLLLFTNRNRLTRENFFFFLHNIYLFTTDTCNILLSLLYIYSLWPYILYFFFIIRKRCRD